MKMNQFQYEVYGQDANAEESNSTWVQRNKTHANHRERKIFRYELKDAPAFPLEQIPVKFQSVSKLS